MNKQVNNNKQMMLIIFKLQINYYKDQFKKHNHKYIHIKENQNNFN